MDGMGYAYPDYSKLFLLSLGLFQVFFPDDPSMSSKIL